MSNLGENKVDALLTTLHITTKRLDRFDYASGLPPIRLVALYQSRPTTIIFDALTANIGWQMYLLFFVCIASFGVLYRLTENVLLPPERVSFMRLLIEERSFAARESVAHRTRVHAAAKHAQYRA